VPPIIFVSALIFLVVLLGKKTAFLKKRGEIFVSRTEKLPENEKKGETWKKIWTSILRFLERVMFLAKIGIKKSEGSVSNVLNRMKEKRLGKNHRTHPIKEAMRSCILKAKMLVIISM